MPDPVPLEPSVEIGPVDPEGKLVLPENLENIFSPGLKKRPLDPVFRRGRDSLQTGYTRPFQEPHQNGFHLVVRRMSHKDFFRVVSLFQSLEKIVTFLPGFPFKTGPIGSAVFLGNGGAASVCPSFSHHDGNSEGTA
ncbi:MAG: hypothetical protein WBB46_11225 [Candidatus Deferrimicrobiaceae bacterium]